MLKNIFIPLVLIFLTSIGTIYLWFDNAPLSFFGFIGVLTLGIGSIYISYYLFFKIFPDKRNIALPNLKNLTAYYTSQKDKPQAITKGSIFGGLFSFILTGLGVYSWAILADKYKEYELNNFGQDTKSVIINTGYTKGIGTYREYEYLDNVGKVHTDKFSNKSFSVGDTIQIKYSTKRPIINQVILMSDEN
jgi:hypothetical protein